MRNMEVEFGNDNEKNTLVHCHLQIQFSNSNISYFFHIYHTTKFAC